MNPRNFLRGKRTGIDEPRRNYVYQMVEIENPNIYLDVACGPGIDCEGLKNKGLEIHYVGLDLASKFLVYSKKRFHDAEFVMASAERIPFRDKTIEFVTCKDLLEHLPTGNESTLKEMLRVGSKKVVVSWFIPPREEPKKMGVIYSYDNLLHKIFVFLFTLLFGSIQFNIYNKSDLLDIVSKAGAKLTRITQIGTNFNRDPCEVWEIASQPA